MIEVAALGFIALLMLGVPDGRIRYSMEVARKGWICFGGSGLLLLWWVKTGGSAPVSWSMMQATGVCVLIWGLATLSADRSEIAAWQALPFAMAVALGVFVFSGLERLTLFRVLVATALIHVMVVLIENGLRIRLFENVPWRKKFEARGLIGNPNAAGAYLVPHLFLCAWLGVYDSGWWFLALPFLALALFRTQCRAALLGAAAGGWAAWMMYDPMAVVLILPTGGTLFLVNPHTFKERAAYWRVAWRQIRRTPLFGCGPDHWKRHVPELQAEIDRERGGEFLREENYQDPWPRQAHSVPIQILLDVGALGLVGTVFPVWVAFMSSPDPWLVAALAGMGVAGLLFHAHSYVPVNLVFWALVGHLAASGAHTGAQAPAWILLPLALLVVLSATYISPWVRWARAEQQAMEAEKAGDHEAFRKHLVRALRQLPKSTLTNTEAARYSARAGDRATAYVHAARAFYHYDGDVYKWAVYANLGNMLRDNGALRLADGAYSEAQRLMPRWRLPEVLKAQLAKMVIRMEMQA